MVIVTFSVPRMCEQVARCAGVSNEEAKRILFQTGLQADYEAGRISAEQFHERFCQESGRRVGGEALAAACNDIFELNLSVLPILARLQECRQPMGLLSNTSPGHWEHCRRTYRILEGFQTCALSYQIGACKPDKEIFAAAARLAGVPSEEIFFIDDLPGHVAAARAAGFDAVVFQSARQLAIELRRRAVPLPSY